MPLPLKPLPDRSIFSSTRIRKQTRAHATIGEYHLGRVTCTRFPAPTAPGLELLTGRHPGFRSYPLGWSHQASPQTADSCMDTMVGL